MDSPPPADGATNQSTTQDQSGWLGAYFAVHAALSRLCLKLAVAGTLLITLAVLYQIFGRYVLNDSPSWTEIFALVLVLWVTCFAAAVGVRDDRHIGVESILLLAPKPVRKAGSIVVYLGMITFGLCMSWGGAVLSTEMWAYVNPGLPISQGWSYVPLAIGGILIAVFAIERIVATLLNIKVVASWH